MGQVRELRPVCAVPVAQAPCGGRVALLVTPPVWRVGLCWERGGLGSGDCGCRLYTTLRLRSREFCRVKLYTAP